jgi:hypothetical protein
MTNHRLDFLLTLEPRTRILLEHEAARLEISEMALVGQIVEA